MCEMSYFFFFRKLYVRVKVENLILQAEAVHCLSRVRCCSEVTSEPTTKGGYGQHGKKSLM